MILRRTLCTLRGDRSVASGQRLLNRLTLIVYAKICLAIAIPVHIDAQDGSLLTLDIDVVGADMLRGWSVSISLPDTAVSYVDESFQPTVTIADFQPTVSVTTAGVSVGGSATGPGSALDKQSTLGTLQLSANRSPDDFSVLVTGYTLDLVTLGEHSTTLSLEIQFTRDTPVGDFTGDGSVDFSDFFLFADKFGTDDPQIDIYADGIVDFSDFFLFADNFGIQGNIVGRVTLRATDVLKREGVVVIGTIDTEGVGVVDIEGTVAPKDTVNVEIIGTISD